MVGAKLWVFESKYKAEFESVFEKWIYADNVHSTSQSVNQLLNYFELSNQYPDAVLTFDEFGTSIAAVVCQKLKLP
eukprot:Pgem_evm1s10095